MHTRQLHFLMPLFLAAASACMTQAKFEEEAEAVSCDLAALCPSGGVYSCDVPWWAEKTECDAFRAGKAAQCIEQLEERLLEIEEGDTELCFADIPDVCYDALRERQTGECASMPVAGRPLREAQSLLLAESARGDVWSQAAPTGIKDERLAAAWLTVAHHEHASVAAFSRLTLELIALGAPPHLLERCQGAALDEIAHAKLALTHARELSGQAYDFGPLPLPTARSLSLEALAIETLLDGCIGEGVASLIAHEAARRDPRFTQSCSRIAREELEHAKLAWAILGWCLDQDPSLHPKLLATLDAEAVALADLPPSSRLVDEAFGLLSHDESVTLRRQLIREAVRPALVQLGPSAPTEAPLTATAAGRHAETR